MLVLPIEEKPQDKAPDLDEKIVAQFESCSTLDELKEVWEGLSTPQRNLYAKVKNTAKARLS